MKLVPTLLLVGLFASPASALWPPVRECHPGSGRVRVGFCDSVGAAQAQLPTGVTGGVPVQLRLGTEGPDDPEGYQLTVAPQAISIVARRPAGLFYGAETLRQLTVNGTCAVQTVRDWPALRWRAVQVDMSRGPVPTLDYLKQTVRTCARYKLNMLGLYMEHTFQFKEHPLIGPPGGSLSRAELQELSRYAKDYYVTLLPEQQVFGHLHHVLKYERYADLAETPHGNVVAPSEASYKFIADLYRETVPLFDGPFLHIGADETVELGMGRSHARAQSEGIGKVYLEHLRRVAEILAPYHKRILFWGDVAVHYPELLKLLPHDAVAVAWNYEATADYKSLIDPFVKAGLDSFVAPGASNWSRIYPDYDVAFQNIDGFLAAGKLDHSIGTILTTWNDDNEALMEQTWPALAYGAGAAWSLKPVDRTRFYAAYGNGEVLENLATAHQLLRHLGLGSASNVAFWLDPFTATGRSYGEKALPVAAPLRLAAERALESLLHQSAPDPALELAARRLDAFGLKLQLAPEISVTYRDACLHLKESGRVAYDLAKIAGINGLLQDLREDSVALKHEYADCWARENRPYYLDNVLVRYDLAAQLYQRKIELVQAAGVQYEQTGTLPSSQEVGL